jgi:hypothetical protein
MSRSIVGGLCGEDVTKSVFVDALFGAIPSFKQLSSIIELGAKYKKLRTNSGLNKFV